MCLFCLFVCCLFVCLLVGWLVCLFVCHTCHRCRRIRLHVAPPDTCQWCRPQGRAQRIDQRQHQCFVKHDPRGVRQCCAGSFRRRFLDGARGALVAAWRRTCVSWTLAASWRGSAPGGPEKAAQLQSSDWSAISTAMAPRLYCRTVANRACCTPSAPADPSVVCTSAPGLLVADACDQGAAMFGASTGQAQRFDGERPAGHVAEATELAIQLTSL